MRRTLHGFENDGRIQKLYCAIIKDLADEDFEHIYEFGAKSANEARCQFVKLRELRQPGRFIEAILLKFEGEWCIIDGVHSRKVQK